MKEMDFKTQARYSAMESLFPLVADTAQHRPDLLIAFGATLFKATIDTAFEVGSVSEEHAAILINKIAELEFEYMQALGLTCYWEAVEVTNCDEWVKLHVDKFYRHEQSE